MITGLTANSKLCNFVTLHSSMPDPLAPDPIRVQSCVCCIFWTNRNCMASMAVSSIFLSISFPIRDESLYRAKQ